MVQWVRLIPAGWHDSAPPLAAKGTESRGVKRRIRAIHSGRIALWLTPRFRIVSVCERASTAKGGEEFQGSRAPS